MSESNLCAGVLIVARSTSRVLLLLRNEHSTYPSTWSIVAGHVKKGEHMFDGLKREVKEEINIDPEIIDYYLAKHEQGNDVESEFYYYIGFVDKEFECELNNENDNWGWFNKNNLPTPLFPHTATKIENL